MLLTSIWWSMMCFKCDECWKWRQKLLLASLKTCSVNEKRDGRIKSSQVPWMGFEAEVTLREGEREWDSRKRSEVKWSWVRVEVIYELNAPHFSSFLSLRLARAEAEAEETTTPDANESLIVSNRHRGVIRLLLWPIFSLLWHFPSQAKFSPHLHLSLLRLLPPNSARRAEETWRASLID